MATDMDMRRRSDCGGGLGVSLIQRNILGSLLQRNIFWPQTAKQRINRINEFRGRAGANDELRRERPERATSSQPRATPWVPRNKTLRPVRAKVWAHLLFITFALTGRRGGTYVNPGRCPGLRTCWAFSPCRVARMYRNRKIRSIRTYGARPAAPAPLKGAHI